MLQWYLVVDTSSYPAATKVISIFKFNTILTGAYSSPGFLQFAKAALHPAESEIAPLKQELCTCGKEVREEIALASTQSAIKERRLQLVEREAATKFRHRASTFFGKTDKANAQTRQWQLNLEARESRLFSFIVSAG